MVFEFGRPTFLNKAQNCTPFETFPFVANPGECKAYQRESERGESNYVGGPFACRWQMRE